MLLHTFERLLAGPVSTPPQITANQNDYSFAAATIGSTEDVTGNDELTLQRLSSDASRTLTGIAAKGHSWLYVLVNVGSQSIVLANESSLSVAANRMITGTAGNITVAPSESVSLVYDGVSSRWRCFSKVYSSTGGSIIVQDEGVQEAAAATTLNFEGNAVTAVDQGGGVVDITITAGGITEAEAIELNFAFGD